MIFIAGISIAFFIGFLLLGKKNKSLADRVLFGWIVLIALHLTLFYVITGEITAYWPRVLGFEIPLPLLHGVFLYLYVAAMTEQLPQGRWLACLHFLPVLLSYAYLSLHFLGMPGEEKAAVYAQQGAGYETFMTIHLMAVQLSGLVYIIWSLILLKRHRRHIEAQFSNLEPVNLQWLRMLTIGLGVIWLLVIFVQVEWVTYLGVVLYVFLIGYFGIRQVGIFTPEHPLISEEAPAGKYAKSGLTEERSEQLFQALQNLMEEEQVYRNNELSLSDLATRLDVHPNYLSQLINERDGRNFYDFVNTYRIEEFKRLATQPNRQRYTLLALAYECGFNSKSSFNRYFKKATGQTPSEYLRQHA